MKYRHLLSNMAKPSAEEKRILVNKELKLQKMRTASTMKRDVTIAISAKGFRTTGIFCDLVQVRFWLMRRLIRILVYTL